VKSNTRQERAEWAKCIARDLRLARSVAIRVLPAQRPLSPAVRARFEQEAKSISALQRPKYLRRP